jgi:2-keto-4-pentenoate hydratase/2-oxohepta-3-ene-1,7-dioic acid hydratase in catechol pathway
MNATPLMKTNALAVTKSETTTIDQRRPALSPTVPVGSVGIDQCSHSNTIDGVEAGGTPALRARLRRAYLHHGDSGGGPLRPASPRLRPLTKLTRMRLGRIASPDGVAFVSIEGEHDDMTVREIAEHPFGTPTFTGRSWPLADVRLLAPILASKVVCIGKNYADHIAEMGGRTGPVPADPVIFLKPNTAIIGPNVPIRLPANASPVHFEGELAAVIGRPCKDITADRAAESILGYTIGNDVSARDQQKSDGQWTRAKGHDTFCPVGPWIETDVDPADLELRTEVNGEVKQDSRTSLMIHDVGAIVEWISGVMTLLPGDLILTGTPAGVGPIVDGDTVNITISGIGTLSNPGVKKQDS